MDGSPLIQTSDNQFLSGGQDGLLSSYVQLSVRSFRVISLAQSAGPINSPNETTAIEPEAGGPQLLLALLPTADEAPAGLTLSVERQRSLEDVSQAFAAPEEMIQLFEGWDWQANAYREFAPPNGVP